MERYILGRKDPKSITADKFAARLASEYILIDIIANQLQSHVTVFNSRNCINSCSHLLIRIAARLTGSQNSQPFGHPSLPNNLYAFTPNPNEGAKNSKLFGQVSYGWDLSGTPEEVLAKGDNKVQLKWLMEAYKLFPQKDSFFLKSNGFNRLAGNDVLMHRLKMERVKGNKTKLGTSIE